MSEQPTSIPFDVYLSSIERESNPLLKLKGKSGLYIQHLYRYGPKPFSVNDDDYFARFETRYFTESPNSVFQIKTDLSTSPVRWPSYRPRQINVLDNGGSVKYQIVNIPVTEVAEVVLTPKTIVGTTDLTSCTGIWTYKRRLDRKVQGMLYHSQFCSPADWELFINYAKKLGYPTKNTHLIIPGYKQEDIDAEESEFIRNTVREEREGVSKVLPKMGVDPRNIWYYRQSWIGKGNLHLTPAVILTSEGFRLYSAEKQFEPDSKLWK